jgi:RNA 2',3'-cyclic 3'-phosphodiesterase
MVRLFVAIDLPEDIREQFRDVQEALSTSRARLTMVGTESMHITLKFIGEVNGSSLKVICDALGSIKYPAFSMQAGLITPNSNRSPRIIWAEISDNGNSSDLVRLIDGVLSPLGIEPEKRKYHPHVTIARIRQFHESVFEMVASVAGSCSGNIPATKFTLKKSELTPGGPIYTDIITIPLLEP